MKNQLKNLIARFYTSERSKTMHVNRISNDRLTDGNGIRAKQISQIRPGNNQTNSYRNN